MTSREAKHLRKLLPKRAGGRRHEIVWRELEEERTEMERKRKEAERETKDAWEELGRREQEIRKSLPEDVRDRADWRKWARQQLNRLREEHASKL